MTYSEVQEIKARLRCNPKAVLDGLRADWRPAGQRFVFVQPPYAYNASSFWVALHDGSWKDEVGSHPSGIDRGDVIALIQRIRGDDFKAALDWARGFLGMGPSVGYRPPSREEIARREAEAREREARYAREAEEKSSKLFAHWRGLPRCEGTLGETYLRAARRLPLDRLGAFPHSLRFEARARHIDPATGEVTEWPAICALIARRGKSVALHRTWLQWSGYDKAPVDPPRMVFGPKQGGAIRLWFGRDGLRPRALQERFERDGTRLKWFLGEGVETTLSAACALPGYGADAAVDLGNIARWAWPDYVSDLIWLKENDAHPQARAAAAKAEAHLREQARAKDGRLHVRPAPEGHNDINDFLKAQG